MNAPVNIWSGTRDGRLAAALTNPTELARKKGRVRGHYPVFFRGVRYADAEAAYQAHKMTVRKGAIDELLLGGREELMEAVVELLRGREELMAEILLAKLEQHPKLAAAVARAGGETWLAACSHVVYGRGWWEGEGLASPFIRALVVAWRLHTAA